MQKIWIKHKAAWALMLSILILPFNGCVYLVVGSLGALGGYVASPDTVEGTIIDSNYDEVWRQAVVVVSHMGVLESRNEAGGMLEATIQGAQVKVTLFRVGTNSVKLTVKARRMLFPRIKIAQDVYIKIARDLKTEDQWRDDWEY